MQEQELTRDLVVWNRDRGLSDSLTFAVWALLHLDAAGSSHV